MRWALTEAIQRTPAGNPVRQRKDFIIARRGKRARNIANVAAARELLTLVFYGMRDHQIRCLASLMAPRRATCSARIDSTAPSPDFGHPDASPFSAASAAAASDLPRRRRVCRSGRITSTTSTPCPAR
jgi:hypothetical protein